MLTHIEHVAIGGIIFVAIVFAIGLIVEFWETVSAICLVLVAIAGLVAAVIGLYGLLDAVGQIAAQYA